MEIALPMIAAGIDVGAKNVHIVIIKDGQILTKGSAPTGMRKAEAVGRLYDDVLKKAALRREQVDRVMATGRGAKRVAFATGFIAEVEADARSVIKRIPSARTIVDVGAEQARTIKVGPDGRVIDFSMNDRCAAGTGTFVEAMARVLEVSIEEMAEMATQSTRSISMNAQCAVFGESEVISLIHQKVTKPDISRAVMDAVAGRIGSLVRTIGLEKEVVIVGGMARNAGFVQSLKRELNENLIAPEDAEYFGALGAAEGAL